MLILNFPVPPIIFIICGKVRFVNIYLCTLAIIERRFTLESNLMVSFRIASNVGAKLVNNRRKKTWRYNSTIYWTRIILQCLLITILVVGICAGQVNFSPYWNQGKRSSGSVAITPDECKSSMDSLIYLYKLIQNEAQKIVDCEKMSSWISINAQSSHI